MEHWKIATLILGKGPRDKSFFTYLKNPGVKIEIGMLAWLLFKDDKKIIVDTGPSPPSKTATFHKPVTQTPDQTLEEQLKRFDTHVDDIKIVINTHLHWDHCYGNHLFKKARFFVQRKEIEYARNPLPTNLEMYEVKQEGITPPFEGIDFEFIDGDADLLPGIRVMLTPGHTPGIQTVCVETREGLYLLPGDNLPLYDNIDVPQNKPFIPNAILTNLKDYFESFDRIKAVGGKIIPGHDLRVLEKTIYP